MENEGNQEQSADSPKKLVLKLRERKAVPTSRGIYYVRHLVMNDLPRFNAYCEHKVDAKPEDFPALGELAVKTFTCLEPSSDKPPPLTDAAFSALSTEDLKALADCIAEVGQLGQLPDGPTLEALGSALSSKLRLHSKQFAETTARINKAMDTSFGTMSASVKASLADNLSGMAAIRESLRDSSAVSAMRNELQSHGRLLGMLPKDIIAQSEYAKTLGLESAAEVFRQIKEDEKKVFGKIPKPALEELERQSQASGFVPHALESPVLRFQPVSETPVGRAAIAGEESARQLREVAGLAGEMTDKIANLSEVMLTEVLPKWFENLQDGAKTTNDGLDQARKSVNLAKKAIIWSIVVTVAMTMWQLEVAREYKLENDAQQNTTEALMREQLKESQALNKQLAEDSKRLNEQLARMNEVLANVPQAKAIPPPQSTGTTTPPKSTAPLP